MLAGHQRRSRRSADGRHIESIEYQTGVGQRIDVRRGQLRGAVEADVVPSLWGVARCLRLNRERLRYMGLFQRIACSMGICILQQQKRTYHIVGQAVDDVRRRFLAICVTIGK